MSASDRSPLLPDAFDAAREKLDGLPDIVKTGDTTIRVIDDYGRSETYILQTVRQREVGDRVFLEIHTADVNLRLVIPPKVTKAIARQRDALTDKARSKASRAEAQRRRDEGIVPFERKGGAA